MITNPRQWWLEMHSSFWFVPALIVLGAVALATVLSGIDTNGHLKLEIQLSLFFRAGASGSRGLLTTVASSMVTVAGVVFSTTIAALALTSSQYTSRGEYQKRSAADGTGLVRHFSP